MAEDLNKAKIEALSSEYFSKDKNILRGITNFNSGIVKGDGMLGKDISLATMEHYFIIGRSSIDLIIAAMEKVGMDKGDARTVLDFGCGYGRVIRWLKGYFSEAAISGYDIDRNAISQVGEFFGVDAFQIDAEWTNIPDKKFDIIWVGSVFTHLNEEKFLRLMKLLTGLLNDNGIICFTTHGNLVVHRLRTRERNYNLADDVIAGVIDQYDRSGYGYSDYSNYPGYGISINNLSKLDEILEKSGLKKIQFVDHGWAKHQDFCAAVRN